MARQADGDSFVALVAEREGQLLGRASAGFMPQHTPAGDLRCLVAVAPAHRRQGVGSALWRALEELLRERRPAHLRANGNGEDPDSVAWAERRGFAATQHLLFQRLDLTAWDEAAWLPLVEAAEARAFRFVPFAALRTAETEERLHRLYQEYLSQTPDAAEAAYMELGPWREWAFQGEGAWPEGWIVLLDPAGAFAGFSLLQRSGEDGAHIFMTGVSQAYRGQGLSLALKAAVHAHGAREGLKWLTTLNHAANGAIVTVNRKLGYQVTESVIRLVKATGL